MNFFVFTLSYFGPAKGFGETL